MLTAMMNYDLRFKASHEILENLVFPFRSSTEVLHQRDDFVFGPKKVYPEDTVLYVMYLIRIKEILQVVLIGLIDNSIAKLKRNCEEWLFARIRSNRKAHNFHLSISL